MDVNSYTCLICTEIEAAHSRWRSEQFRVLTQEIVGRFRIEDKWGNFGSRFVLVVQFERLAIAKLQHEQSEV